MNVYEMSLEKICLTKSNFKEIGFQIFLKNIQIGDVLTLLGSMFQSQGAQTEKALSPKYFNFERCSCRLMPFADRNE